MCRAGGDSCRLAEALDDLFARREALFDQEREELAQDVFVARDERFELRDALLERVDLFVAVYRDRRGEYGLVTARRVRDARSDRGRRKWLEPIAQLGRRADRDRLALLRV